MQHYFEFSENEYYGLVAVYVDKNDLKTKPYKKATEIYVRNIGGESVEVVLEEASPIHVTKEYAFMKFMYAPNTLEVSTGDLIKEFENTKDGVLLVDGSLI
ncbi:hypothetical protein CHH83_01305 [Bacillus sp. 7586-K]|nr:hypothetical protein CHH83_01305 [Bacillus sp. 7586-K]